MIQDVKSAIVDRLRSLNPAALSADVPGYTLSPAANLISGFDSESVLRDFVEGDGKELQGSRPKFCAAYSSSALAANSFGPYRLDPQSLVLAGRDGFETSRFEKKLSTGLGGTSPNLDFLAEGPGSLVAVESKFTEFLTEKKASFVPAYDDVVRRLAEPCWKDLFGSLREDPARFGHLDAAQLVKHYLGMRHSLGGHRGSKALAYVYWEPTDAIAHREFVSHRAAIREFASAVVDSEIRFLSFSYPDLWDEWETTSAWSGIRAHVAALRRRYLLSVQPPAQHHQEGQVKGRQEP